MLAWLYQVHIMKDHFFSLGSGLLFIVFCNCPQISFGFEQG